MISTQQMTYLLALVETGSFSKAAERCFVTQPTLSMQVKKAEELLGFSVFYRDSGQLELTDFGRELIPLLRQIQSDVLSVESLKERFSGTFQDRLRIGIIPTIACYMLPDMFAEWQELLPQTRLHISEYRTEELLVMLEERKVDVAILAGPVESASWRSVPLFTEEIVAYTKDWTKHVIHLDELRSFDPWLLTKGNCLRTQMMHFCALSEEGSNRWNYAGGNLDMLVRLVDANGGYTLIPEKYVATFNRNSDRFKRIVNENGQSPGRSVIALSAYRHTSWNTIEKMIRSVQLRYAGAGEHLELLSWK